MKKRSFYQFLLPGIITLVAVLFPGCTEDLSFGVTTTPISLTIDDIGFEDMKPVTRGARITTSGINTIGVSASVYSSSSSYTSAGCGSYFFNERVTPGTPTNYYWPTSDYKLSFFAYYPYGNVAFTLQSNASTTGSPTYAYTVPSVIANQVDIMTGQDVNHLGGGSSSVSLTMKHRCAAVSFSVTNSRSSAITLTSVSIEGVKYTGTLNEDTWTLTSAVNSSSSNPFTLTYGSAIAASTTVDVTGTTNIFLMLPQTIPAGAMVKVVIDGEDPLYADLTGLWAAGKKYNYSLTVKNNMIIIVDDDSDVEDWKLKLPAGYTLLEYIENQGDSWIDTGCTLDFSETIKIKMSVSDYRGNYGGIFGNYGNEDSNCTRIIQNNGNPNKALIYLNNKAYAGGKGCDINGLNQVNTFEISADDVVVNGSSIGLPSTVHGNEYNTNIKLFRYSNNSVYGKLYGFLISGKRDMVPVRSPENVVGMYDTINGVFYGSATSTPFIAGPEI